MAIPPAVLIHTLSSHELYVLRFQHVGHTHDPKPHYWAFLPVRGEEFLCFCMLTSQLESRLRYYERTPQAEMALEALYFIPAGKIDFLRSPRGSLVDCNRPELLSRADVLRCISRAVPCRLVAHESQLPAGLRAKLVTKVRLSPLVKPLIKDMLLES